MLVRHRKQSLPLFHLFSSFVLKKSFLRSSSVAQIPKFPNSGAIASNGSKKYWLAELEILVLTILLWLVFGGKVEKKRVGRDIPCHQIEEGLLLGSVVAANNRDELKSKNLTHILTVALLNPAYPNNFVYKVIAVKDREDTNLRQQFEECVDFIDEAKSQGVGVLVHCLEGICRSVTIVFAYLMKKHGMSPSQALDYARTLCPWVNPNPGFILQLQDFEKSLQGLLESELTVRILHATD